MASTRVPILRHLSSCQPRALQVANQRRWAQVHDVRFLATTQQPRNVVEKYRQKLDRKAKEEGHGDIDSLKQAYADKIHDLRQRDASALNDGATLPSTSEPLSPHQSPSSPSSSPFSSPSPAASAIASATSQSSGSGPPQSRPLSSFLDMPKARTLPVPELSAVWRLRHAASPRSLCAVIPAPTYAAMEAAARRNPQFVLPVPHPEQGAEIHFLQWMFDDGEGKSEGGRSGAGDDEAEPARRAPTSTVLFTQLAEYKARGEFAQPHTSITHHLDFAGEKGVVLMQGDVLEGRGVQVDSAKWLVMCLQRFYGGWEGEQAEAQAANPALVRERAEERRKLLEWFGRGDARFSVEKLLEEAERLG